MSKLVIVVSGPGGVGKGTVVHRLVESDPALVLSRSWTTREPRPGEAGDAYTFVNKTDFLNALIANRFLEWNHFLGAHYYGSPMPDPAETRDIVLEIDVNGARQVASRAASMDAPAPVLIFIDAPSLDVQRTRLVGRGDTPEQVERRMAAGEAERTLARDLPYEWIVNDDVESAAARIATVVVERRAMDRTSSDRC
ncbi:MAG: guanylate kinase [Acidimicrobiales bacterium]